MKLLKSAITLTIAALTLVGTSATANGEPTTIGPCDGAGDCQTNRNPHTTRCWGSGRVIHTGPILNVDMNNHANSYTRSIGRIEVWYSEWCKTNWIKTILDDQTTPSTIYQWIMIPPGREGREIVKTDGQTDPGPSAFSMQIYAPGLPVEWKVEVFQNRMKVGWGFGTCGDIACVDFGDDDPNP